MSKCQDLDPLFAPYVDGEVAAADRASVEAHLAKCPPCRDRVAEQRTVREVIDSRRQALRACASDRLRARCAQHARVTGGTTAGSGAAVVRRWVPLSLAATLVLALAGAFFFGLNNKVEALTAQLALDHMTCFQFAPERLQHADAQAAERDWSARQRWGIHVPASSSSNDLELLGVRRCSMSSGHVAHILYRWHGKPLSMFVVPRPVPGAPPQETIEKFGHEAVMWSQGDRTYVVLARARPSDLATVVGYMKANAQ